MEKYSISEGIRFSAGQQFSLADVLYNFGKLKELIKEVQHIRKEFREKEDAFNHYIQNNIHSTYLTKGELEIVLTERNTLLKMEMKKQYEDILNEIVPKLDKKLEKDEVCTILTHKVNSIEYQNDHRELRDMIESFHTDIISKVLSNRRKIEKSLDEKAENEEMKKLANEKASAELVSKLFEKVQQLETHIEGFNDQRASISDKLSKLKKKMSASISPPHGTLQTQLTAKTTISKGRKKQSVASLRSLKPESNKGSKTNLREKNDSAEPQPKNIYQLIEKKLIESKQSLHNLKKDLHQSQHVLKSINHSIKKEQNKEEKDSEYTNLGVPKNNVPSRKMSCFFQNRTQFDEEKESMSSVFSTRKSRNLDIADEIIKEQVVPLSSENKEKTEGSALQYFAPNSNQKIPQARKKSLSSPSLIEEEFTTISPLKTETSINEEKGRRDSNLEKLDSIITELEENEDGNIQNMGFDPNSKFTSPHNTITRNNSNCSNNQTISNLQSPKKLSSKELEFFAPPKKATTQLTFQAMEFHNTKQGKSNLDTSVKLNHLNHVVKSVSPTSLQTGYFNISPKAPSSQAQGFPNAGRPSILRSKTEVENFLPLSFGQKRASRFVSPTLRKTQAQINPQLSILMSRNFHSQVGSSFASDLPKTMNLSYNPSMVRGGDTSSDFSQNFTQSMISIANNQAITIQNLQNQFGILSKQVQKLVLVSRKFKDHISKVITEINDLHELSENHLLLIEKLEKKSDRIKGIKKELHNKIEVVEKIEEKLRKQEQERAFKLNEDMRKCVNREVNELFTPLKYKFDERIKRIENIDTNFKTFKESTENTLKIHKDRHDNAAKEHKNMNDFKSSIEKKERKQRLKIETIENQYKIQIENIHADVRYLKEPIELEINNLRFENESYQRELNRQQALFRKIKNDYMNLTKIISQLFSFDKKNFENEKQQSSNQDQDQNSDSDEELPKIVKNKFLDIRIPSTINNKLPDESIEYGQENSIVFNGTEFKNPHLFKILKDQVLTANSPESKAGDDSKKNSQNNLNSNKSFLAKNCILSKKLKGNVIITEQEGLKKFSQIPLDSNIDLPQSCRNSPFGFSPSTLQLKKHRGIDHPMKNKNLFSNRSKSVAKNIDNRLPTLSPSQLFQTKNIQRTLPLSEIIFSKKAHHLRNKTIDYGKNPKEGESIAKQDPILSAKDKNKLIEIKAFKF